MINNSRSSMQLSSSSSFTCSIRWKMGKTHKKPRSSPLRKRKREKEKRKKKKKKSIWKYSIIETCCCCCSVFLRFFSFLCDVMRRPRFLVFCRCCCWIRNSFLLDMFKRRRFDRHDYLLYIQQHNILTSQVITAAAAVENITLNITQNV